VPFAQVKVFEKPGINPDESVTICLMGSVPAMQASRDAAHSGHPWPNLGEVMTID
jgi:hypothetical protein